MSRWFDPYLNHWIQPDSIIPDSSKTQSYDRYAYANNSPIVFNDPKGHDVNCGIDEGRCRKLVEYEKKYGDKKVDFMLRLHEYLPLSPDWFLDELPIAAARFITHEILWGNPQGWEDLKNNKEVIAQAVVFMYPGSTEKPEFILPNGQTLDSLSKGAALEDRNGLTTAGRSLQKHGDREGSALPQIKGGPKLKNDIGQFILDEILTNPGSSSKTRTWSNNGVNFEVIEMRAPTGWGLRFDATSGQFIGFLEP